MPASEKLTQWLATPRGRRLAIMGGAAVSATAAVGLIAFGLRERQDKEKRKKTGSGTRGAPTPRTKVAKGRLLCPYELNRNPVNPQSIRKNDFVVLRLISNDATFNEEVWGHVLSVSPGNVQFLVELSTPLISTGLSPLRSDKHGFTIGEKVTVEGDCVYDVLHSPPVGKYQIICGILLEDLGYQSSMGPKETLAIKTGDFVTVVVGNPPVSASALPGKTWNEPLRISVTSTGKTGNVIHGLVWDDPSLEVHGLSKFSKLEFTRDCIVKD